MTKNIAELYQQSLLKVTDEFKEPPVCLSLGEGKDKSIICTLGNISLIIGKSKSRKTYLVSALAAAFLKNGTMIGFKSELPEHKRQVLYVDTEQGQYHSKRVLDRIAISAGHTLEEQPENLLYLSLRQFNPEIRAEIVEHAIQNNKNLGVVIIDGIRDLLYSFNDEKESVVLVTKLMKWSLEKEIHISTILHQNKGDDHARGHLGSELTNKSESVIEVRKESDNKDISIILSHSMRDKDFQDIPFSVNEDDIPVEMTNYVPENRSNTKNRKEPESFDDQVHKNLLEGIFTNGQVYSKNQLEKALCLKSEKSGIHIGTNKARTWIDYYLSKDFIKNQGGKNGASLMINL